MNKEMSTDSYTIDERIAKIQGVFSPKANLADALQLSTRSGHLYTGQPSKKRVPRNGK